MATPTVCVLGGSGFVGTRLCARLASAGWRVTVPTRDPAKARHLGPLPAIRLVGADVHTPDVLAGLLRGQQAVINLIGILNEPGRDGSGFMRAHAGLAGTLVAACRREGVPRLLQMSALRADPERGPSHYLRSKGLAERIIRDESGPGLAWTLFRPSVIFGRGDSFTLRFAALLRLAPGVLPLACPQSRFAPVWIEDVVDAMLRALADPHSAGETYPLCGPEEFTLIEIVRRVRDELGLRRAVIGLPDGLARLQAALMDFLPGKPFSTDNYRSLSVDSTSGEDGFARLGLRRHAFSDLLPRFLHGSPQPLIWRQRAGR